MRRVWLLALSTLVLVPLAWWCAHGYRWTLGTVVCQLFALAEQSVSLYDVGVGFNRDGLIFLDRRWSYQIAFYGPVDLALYVSLCLASLRATRAARGGAILKGVPILIALQLVSIALCLAILMRAGAAISSSARGHDTEFPLVRLIMSSVAWVGPLAVWVSLLGRSELDPRGFAVAAGTSPARRTGRQKAKP